MKKQLTLVELQAEIAQIRLEIDRLMSVEWDPEVDGPSPFTRILMLQKRRSEIILSIRGNMVRGAGKSVVYTPLPLDWTSIEQVVFCPVLILGLSEFHKDPWGVDRSIPQRVEIVKSPNVKEEPTSIWVSAFPNEVGSVMLAHPPSDRKGWIEQGFKVNQSLKPIK